MPFDKSKYKIYTWKHPAKLFWIVNPLFAVTELVLGIRAPKLYLLDTTSDKPRYERGYVPCPHCQTLHDSRTWSVVNGTSLKNWFGLYCNRCGNVIPCVINLGTVIILAVTFPVWIWFWKRLREAWLKKQPSRFEHLDPESVPDPFSGKGWIKQGLIFGLLLFVWMTGYDWFTDGLTDYSLRAFVISLVIHLCGGLSYGYLMKRFSGEKVRKTTA